MIIGLVPIVSVRDSLFGKLFLSLSSPNSFHSSYDRSDALGKTGRVTMKNPGFCITGGLGNGEEKDKRGEVDIKLKSEAKSIFFNL